jgi:hypothetical protein
VKDYENFDFPDEVKPKYYALPVLN